MIPRAYHRFLDALAAVSGLLILAAMLGVSADVIARYTIGRPIIWMFEMTEYALLYIPCFGMAWLAREHGHVAITSFVEKFSPGLRKVIAIATMLGCAAICAIIAYWGGVLTLDRFMRGTVAAQIVRVPEYLILWVIPFGFGVAAIEFLRLAWVSPVPVHAQTAS